MGPRVLQSVGKDIAERAECRMGAQVAVQVSTMPARAEPVARHRYASMIT
ncbi:hypothetical protein SMD44_08109 [Streptomyces alboflavus]|uniref:Uncharacterized protein n=1 Tax=Streptomyces alboflavus TaxID=67267 RepID=A0A1Z1WQM9_9ACTN|nr:hypothetical protein SMD44_08109 [Streptomyces alboflavus]